MILYESFPLRTHPLTHLKEMFKEITAPEQLLTRKEVAEILQLSPHTLTLWAATGKNLPFIKCGRYVRYKPQDVRDYIERNRHGVAIK
jgi:excisionase family DNA binding protein